MSNVTNYVATPTGARFMQSNAPMRLIQGPVGSGKSVTCVVEIARRAQEQAPSKDGIRYTRCIVIRNTSAQLQDTVIKTFFDWFPDGVAGTWKETTKTFTLRFGDVHCEVLFRALDRPEDVQRLLSLEATFVYLNEVREIPLEIVIAARSRVGRYPSPKDVGPTWHGVWADTNPPSTDHWIYEKFEVEKPEGWEIFKQPSGLSPEAENRENLPPTYYEDMMTGASEEWIKVHVHGQYGRSMQGRPVYEESFDTDFHTRDELLVVRGAPVIIGLDAGRTPAASFMQLDPRGRTLLLDERTSENMGMEKFLSSVVKPLLFERYYGHRAVVGADPAVWHKSQLNEKSVADIIHEAGLTLSRMVDTSNRLAPRLLAVESKLALQAKGEAMLLIDKTRCPQTVAGFEHGYRYKMKRDGTYELTPEKNAHSHLADAIQYGCQIVDRAGNEAQNPNRARKVTTRPMTGWT